MNTVILDCSNAFIPIAGVGLGPRGYPLLGACIYWTWNEESGVDSGEPSERELQTLRRICEVWEKLGKDYRQILEKWDPVTPERFVWKQRMLNGLDLIGK